MYSKIFILSLFTYLNCVYGIDENFVDNLKNQIPLDSLPIENATNALKQRCERIGGPDAFDRLNEARGELEKCIQDEFNATTMMDEIEKAKPTGDLDLVFGKYCGKKQYYLDCINKFANVLEDCMEAKEKEHRKMFTNISLSLVDFLCYKNGDRIAMFIAEGGFECIKSQQDEIQKCVNETMKIPNEVPSIDKIESLPLMVLGEQQCHDMDTMSKCVVRKLEGCSEPTPANIVEALFKFIRKVTPCSRVKKETEPKQVKLSSEPSSAMGISLSLSSLAAAFGTFLVYR